MFTILDAGMATAGLYIGNVREEGSGGGRMMLLMFGFQHSLKSQIFAAKFSSVFSCRLPA